jgi:hypothetical protein
MALKLLSHSVCGYVIKLSIEIVFVSLFLCALTVFSMKGWIVEKGWAAYSPRARLTPDNFKLQQYRKKQHLRAQRLLIKCERIDGRASPLTAPDVLSMHSQKNGTNYVSLTYDSGVPSGGGSTPPPKIPKFRQGWAEFPAPWNIHP